MSDNRRIYWWIFLGSFFGVALSIFSLLLINNLSLTLSPFQFEKNTPQIASSNTSLSPDNLVLSLLEKERLNVGEMIEELKKRIAILKQKEQQSTLEDAKDSDPYLEELKKQRAIARSQAADATAQVALLETLLNKSEKYNFSEYLNSPIIQKMKEDYYALLRREAALATSLGDRHPNLIEVRSEISSITSQLHKELSDLASSYQNQKAFSLAKERDLEQAIEEAEREKGRIPSSQLERKDLEDELASKQKLYLALFEKIQQLGSKPDHSLPVQSQSTVTQPALDIRVIILFLMILTLGLLGGFGLSSFGSLWLGKTPAQKEAHPTSQIHEKPIIKTNVRDQLPEISSGTAPFSRTMHQLRKLFEALSAPKTLENRDYKRRITDLTKEICRSAQGRDSYITVVTSAKKGCGASSAVLALAQSAASEGKKTLIIDASSRSHALTEYFKIKTDPEWTVVLDCKEDLQRITKYDPGTCLYFLPIALAEVSSLRPSQLRRLNQGLKEVATSFDLVFLDAGCLLEDDAAVNFVELAQEVLVVGSSSSLSPQIRKEIENILDQTSKPYSVIENRARAS